MYWDIMCLVYISFFVCVNFFHTVLYWEIFEFELFSVLNVAVRKGTKSHLVFNHMHIQ